MKGKPGDTRKEITSHVASTSKHQESKGAQGGSASVAKSVNMPNPLKGLQLSLYPIIKEH